MASGGNERRMVFDIRGRRKHAVRVVYAVLAVLMGLSLFLVVGSFNIAELFNGSSGGGEAAKQFEEQEERLEAKLRRDPSNPDLLLALTRAQVNAANSLVVINPQTGERGATPESRQQYHEAAETWSRYLEATDEPSPSLAQVVAPAFVALTLASKTVPEAKSNLKEAVNAQEMVAKQRPSVGALSTLAIYKYFSFDYKGADQAKREALKLTHAEFEQKELQKRMKAYRESAEQQQKTWEKAEKEEKALSKGGGNALESSLGGSSLGGTNLGE